MKTFVVTALALCLIACGDTPPEKGGEAPAKESAEKAGAQKTLRVEYYEINKK